MSFHNSEYSCHPNYQLISCSVYEVFNASSAENNFMQGSTIIIYFFSDGLLGPVQICSCIEVFRLLTHTKAKYYVLYCYTVHVYSIFSIKFSGFNLHNSKKVYSYYCMAENAIGSFIWSYIILLYQSLNVK